MRYVRLERAHRFFLLAVVTISVVALAVAEGSLIYLLLTLAAVTYSYFRAENPPFSRRMSNFMLILLAVFVVSDYFLLTNSTLLSMVHFLLLVQVLKLLSRRTLREEKLLYFVSLLNMCVAAVLTQALLFAVIFIVYMVTITAGLVVFNIWRQVRRAERSRVLLPSSLFAGLSFMSVFTLVLTVLLFIFLPRVGAGILHSSFGAQSTTGISAEVDLTRSHSIELDESVVAQVKFLDYDEPVDELLYTRCVVFTHYDGNKWRRASPEIVYPDATEEDMIRIHERRYTVPRRIEDRRSVFRLSEGLNNLSNRWRRKLVVRTYLNPTTDYFLPVVGEPERIEFFSRESPRDIFVSRMGTLYYPSPRIETCGYDTFTTVVRRDAPLNLCFNHHRIDGIDYIQLEPESRYFWRSDVKELTKRIIKEAGAESPYEAAVAVADYLRRNYRYTLNPQRRRLDIDPVVEFLFESGSGHCEFFASAMAIMLRTVGIGARVVGGYRGGEWNGYGKFYTIRRKNAHCWVEVFLDDDVDPNNGSSVGWVPFDPTPPYVQPSKGPFSFLSDLLAYIKLRWLNYVIFYDASRWQRVMRGVARRSRKTLIEASEWWHSIKGFFKGIVTGRIMPVVALIVITMGLIILMRLLWWRGGGRGKRSTRRKRPPPPAVLFYRRMLTLAEKHGLRRPLSATPYELLQPLVRLWGRARLNTIAFITEMFVKVRYGNIDLTEEENRMLDEALNLLSATIRHRRP